MIGLSNMVAVARREFLARVRTRSFIVGTALLIVGVVAIAFVPVIVRAIDRSDGQRIAVWNDAGDLGTDPVATMSALLNAPTGGAQTDPIARPDFVVAEVPDLAAARTAVDGGQYGAVLGIERAADGEPIFTLYTNEPASGRLAQVIRQASTAIAIADRLARLGVAPTDQAAIFTSADFGVTWADPARADQAGTDPARDGADEGASYLLGFGMTILIFMMIILYGTWVAMSVVEEKSSRVMEVILNAATPFQLLTGKVLGVGAVALTQYAGLIVAGTVALVLQGPIASMVLGEHGGPNGLPAGLTVTMLILFGVYGVLGFLLYAVLYAAAGSLVSRQEDVNQVVMPMTLISTAGYLIAVYAATGLLDMRAGWISVLAQVPFVSPFLMLSRITAAEAAPWEVLLSVVLLLVTIVAALWLAGRIYAAGVLLYGQRPGVRAVWRLMRMGM